MNTHAQHPPASPSPSRTREPLPGSRKIYVTGSDPSLRVPVREVVQSPSPAGFGAGGRPAAGNPPIRLYDTSGPYT
ncbi:MAG: hypothetical protein ACRD6R_14085, partial [Candidatus Polarisedimenticolia bacterium]